MPVDPKRPDGYELDDLEEVLTWELIRNARVTNSALAAIAGVAPSTCHRRVKELEDAGVILSYHAQVDLKRVGFPVQAVISVRLRMRDQDRVLAFSKRVLLLPPVITTFFLGGPEDFLIHVACTSTDQLRDFVLREVSSDPIVAHTQTNLVFDHQIGSRHMEHVRGWDDMRNL